MASTSLPKVVASPQEKYEIAEEKRLIEEAKVCTFLKSSLSPEMSMLLRSNPEYLLADKANDSYEMYSIAKAITFRTSSFEATQHRVLQMFQCTMTTSHTAYKDELLNHFKALLAMFGSKDPAFEGTCKLKDLALVAYLAGLPDEEFKYPKDKLYAETPAGEIPDMLTVMQSMTQYDLNKRKVPTTLPATDLTPPGPNVLSATTSSSSVCPQCHANFPTVISRKTNRPFTHCQSCHVKYLATLSPPASNIPTTAQLQTKHAAMVAATNAYHQANAMLAATSTPDLDAAYLNTYFQRECNL